MKTKIIILVVVTLVLNGINTRANSCKDSGVIRTAEQFMVPGSSDQINIVATAKNENGENFELTLRVTSTTIDSRKYIINVEYNEGSSWNKVTFYHVLGQKGKYYVTVNSRSYFFEY